MKGTYLIRKSANGTHSYETATVASRGAPKGIKFGGDPDMAFRRAITDHLYVVNQLNLQQDILNSIATRMVEAVLSGGKVLWCGNGGSAADCQHLAAEFVGRFQRNRRGYASIALTTDVKGRGVAQTVRSIPRHVKWGMTMHEGDWHTLKHSRENKYAD
jgi:hypothetical protein